MNVVILSMGRCGISWAMDTIKKIYSRLYGKELTIDYEADRVEISNTLVKGWHSIYNVDPMELLKRGYDKILIVRRPLETMKYEHAKFYGYLEHYTSYEHMQQEREGFFEVIELYWKLIYTQTEVLQDPRVLMVDLKDLNNYTYSTFEEIIEFLEFKLTIMQKIRLFFRILRDKINPFVIACKPTQRNWDVYSAQLPRGHELCNRLQFIEKITKNEEIICQM